MNALRAFLVAVAVMAFPAAAGAALVPPGNSAANQYTETFPTSGGNAEAEGKGKVRPGDVLGARNAKKLDSQGKQGREAAAVVAATAPPAATIEGGGGAVDSGGDAGVGQGPGDETTDTAPSDGGVPATGKGSGSASGRAAAEDPSGSSGFSEVLGQATGSSSSGGTGLLLPLVVLASVIWALAYFLRRRRSTA